MSVGASHSMEGSLSKCRTLPVDAAESLDPSWAGWEFRFHQWHYTPLSLQGRIRHEQVCKSSNCAKSLARVYMNRANWGRSRAENWSAGRSTPNMEYLRVVAGHIA